MSDPLAATLEKLASQEADAAQAQDTAQRFEERTALAQTVSRLSMLLANENYKWFSETCIQPLVDAEMSAALDPLKAAAQGPVHAHRFDMARQLAQLASVTHAQAGAKLDTILLRDKGVRE